MAPKRCKSCGGVDGAHYAFCFGARLFERVMGKGFPLFPPGAFTRSVIAVDKLSEVVEGGTRPANNGRVLPDRPWDYLPGGGIVTYPKDDEAPDSDDDVTAKVRGALEEQAGAIEELRASLERERQEVLAQRATNEALAAEAAELRALLDAATTPEVRHEAPTDEPAVDEPEHEPEHAAPEESPEQVLAELSRPSVWDSEPEPWWWETPAGKEARASVALDGETHVVGEVGNEDAALGDALAQVQQQEQAVAELEAAQDPAERSEIDEVEAAFAEAARRRVLIDELREQVRDKIATTPGLNQKMLSEGIGLNSGTVSQILSGKAHGPSALTHLERMVAVADNLAGATPAPQPEVADVEVRLREPRSGNGLPANLRNSETWVAVDRFLTEATERAEDAWTTAPELQEAYELWRTANDAPVVHPTTLGQVAIQHGYSRGRRNIAGGKQVRGYGGLRLRQPAMAGASQGGGDEAPQDSDGEPNLDAPARPRRELLNPNAERVERDGLTPLLDKIHAQGGSVGGMLASYLAGELITGAPTGVMPPDPARIVVRPPAPVIEHPPGWDDVPGKELHERELRAMASKLVKEQGWGYKRSHGRQGKPKLRNPQGHSFTLPNTPGDYRTVKNTRAALRRLGADL